MVMGVRWLHSLVAGLLLLGWLPAQGHCLLERAGWFWAAEDCCKEPAQPDPCADRFCCHLDSARYKTEFDQVKVVAPDFPASLLLAPEVREPDAPAAQGRTWLRAVPPEMPGRGQFISRSAPPVRAPSFI